MSMGRWLLGLLFAGNLWGCASSHYATVEDKGVTLYLKAPQATTVQFASSIDQFVLHDAVYKGNGVWSFGLANKEFQYFYLVDGKVVLPECRFQQNDDFGSANCRYLP